MFEKRKPSTTGAIAGALLVALVGASLGNSPPASALPYRPAEVHERVAKDKSRPCRNIKRARCGAIKVPLDPLKPAGKRIKIAFELYPRRNRPKPARGTIVAVEGGPGYSTTDSRSYYRELFRPLMGNYRLLLVDNRGTGRSDPILCPRLQSYTGNYVKAVGQCGRQLGGASDLYGSGKAADDLAAVLDHLDIDRINLYGDSYGTFFSQTFAARHPDRLKSLVLDAAYFVKGTDPFYTDTNRALRDAFNNSCRRSPACSKHGPRSMAHIAALAKKLRHRPIRGRAQDADGVVKKLSLNIGGLIYLVTAAATSPSIYRELDAAARAALRDKPYERPLLRLARETFYEGGAGHVRVYSEGLYVAVACNDYPQPYDMTKSVAKRRKQYRAAVRKLERNRPKVFAPFTVREWMNAPVEYYRSCLEWPKPSHVDPPVQPDADFPDVPTLVLAGDLDSLTSPEGARDTADAFPNSTYVEVSNMTHVTALTDFDRCASRIVRRFVRTRSAGDTSCARDYNEIRHVDRFSPLPNGLPWKGARRRTVRTAAATVADVMARWFSMGTYSGRGLIGGSFTTTDGPLIRWRMKDVRWVGGIVVSGTASLDRRNGRIRASIDVGGRASVPGQLRLRWNDWDSHARAEATGRLDGHPIQTTFLAP